MYSDIYYVCFREAERKHWWMKLLKKGFGHCFLLRNDRGCWIKYESGHGVMRVDIVTDYDKLLDECIIIKIKASPKKRKVMFNTCVGLVKLITGAGSGAITPYQLYKRLT